MSGQSETLETNVKKETDQPTVSSTPSSQGKSQMKAAYSGDQYRALENSRNQKATDLKSVQARYHILDDKHKQVSQELHAAHSRILKVEDEHRQALQDLENAQYHFSALEEEHRKVLQDVTDLHGSLNRSATRHLMLEARRSWTQSEWQASYEHNVLLINEVKRLRGIIPPPPAPYSAARSPPTQEALMDLWKEEQSSRECRPRPESTSGKSSKEENGERATKRKK